MPTLHQLYAKLEERRRPFVHRAYQVAQYTIPSLQLDRDGNRENIHEDELQTTYQSIGARGVNNLASKLLVALLPPTAPFFRLRVEGAETGLPVEERREQEQLMAEDTREVERAIQAELEKMNARVPLFEALRHLIYSGNALLHMPDSGGMRFFPLDSFVLRRDPLGPVRLLITRERVSLSSLPDRLREAVSARLQPDPSRPDPETQGGLVSLYTGMEREGERLVIRQEVAGVPVSDPQSLPLVRNPFMALRMSLVPGEDYGRGVAEEYLGDLISAEGLSKHLLEAAAIMARMIPLVDPAGLTNIDDLTNAINGQPVRGRDQDVSFLESNKARELQAAQAQLLRVEDRLSKAFLLNTSVQRQAERVTAEEIRFVAQELEDALGGVYSILTQDFQLPLVERLLWIVQRKGDIPQLQEGVLKPTIITGLDALGRGQEFNRTILANQQIAQLFGPEALQMYTNVGETIRRIYTQAGVDHDGLVKSDEEIAQAQQQREAEELLRTQAAAQAVRGAVDQRQQEPAA